MGGRGRVVSLGRRIEVAGRLRMLREFDKSEADLLDEVIPDSSGVEVDLLDQLADEVEGGVVSLVKEQCNHLTGGHFKPGSLATAEVILETDGKAEKIFSGTLEEGTRLEDDRPVSEGTTTKMIFFYLISFTHQDYSECLNTRTSSHQ